MCIRVYTYVCIHLHIMHVSMYVYMRVLISTYICMYMCEYTYICICTYIHINIYVHLHTCMVFCIYVYTYTTFIQMVHCITHIEHATSNHASRRACSALLFCRFDIWIRLSSPNGHCSLRHQTRESPLDGRFLFFLGRDSNFQGYILFSGPPYFLVYNPWQHVFKFVDQILIQQIICIFVFWCECVYVCMCAYAGVWVRVYTCV